MYTFLNWLKNNLWGLAIQLLTDSQIVQNVVKRAYLIKGIYLNSSPMLKVVFWSMGGWGVGLSLGLFSGYLIY